METGEGILREVKNTGGNRLLSLFSLNAIVSRISFDFRDIFGDGLYFKKNHVQQQTGTGCAA